MECSTEKGCPIKDFFKKHKVIRYLTGISIGLILGFLYYQYFGCTGNSCPITSNPYSTMLFGGLAGLVVVW